MAIHQQTSTNMVDPIFHVDMFKSSIVDPWTYFCSCLVQIVAFQKIIKQIQYITIHHDSQVPNYPTSRSPAPLDSHHPWIPHHL